jgi:hypothetical protein
MQMILAACIPGQNKQSFRYAPAVNWLGERVEFYGEPAVILKHSHVYSYSFYQPRDVNRLVHFRSRREERTYI